MMITLLMDRVALKFYQNYQKTIQENVNRLFGILLVLQYFFLLVVSACLKLDWRFVLVAGLIINFIPACFAFVKPSETYTKYIVCVSQVITSILLMRLGVGVFEIYAYVSISLLLLIAYRDSFLLILLMSAALFLKPLRSLEYSVSLLLEFSVLLFFIYHNQIEMRKIADKQAELNLVSQKFDEEVKKRTAELEEFSYVLAHDARILLNEISEIARKLDDEELSMRLIKMQNFVEDAHDKIRRF